MAKIYTRTGDGGETSLLSGGRVPKDHPMVAAYGTLDELSSVLGLLLCEPVPKEVVQQLTQVQESLLSIGSALADIERRWPHDPETWRPETLERWIDGMEAELPPLQSFLLPGGSRAGALAHLARTVCRRAERGLRTAQPVPEGVPAFVNRLSDALFVLARWLNARLAIPERTWRGGGTGS
jgi:cob(I)alamin adenosyltransferase